MDKKISYQLRDLLEAFRLKTNIDNYREYIDLDAEFTLYVLNNEDNIKSIKDIPKKFDLIVRPK